MDCCSGRERLDKGNKHILLNLADVAHVDSSGIGELVRSHATIRKQGGQLKLININKKVDELLQMTMLSAVFDVQPSEDAAIKSFSQASKAAG